LLLLKQPVKPSLDIRFAFEAVKVVHYRKVVAGRDYQRSEDLLL
jgi:hypothetical protein